MIPEGLRTERFWDWLMRGLILVALVALALLTVQVAGVTGDVREAQRASCERVDSLRTVLRGVLVSSGERAAALGEDTPAEAEARREFLAESIEALAPVDCARVIP